MSTVLTTNYNLIKPQGDEPKKNFPGQNGFNMDTVDTELDDHEDRLVTLEAGARLLDTIYYKFGAGTGTDSNEFTFTKATYPNGQYIIGDAQAAGGGGGLAGATSATERSVGVGGNGGNYAKKKIAFTSLPTSMKITVGKGGAVAAAGGDTIFEEVGVADLIRATGGNGGSTSTGTGTATIRSTSNGTPNDVGDIIIQGENGGPAYRDTTDFVKGGSGGASHLGNGTPERHATSTGLDGLNATPYGAGGSGACNLQSQSQRNGGLGAEGLGILEVWG